MRFEMFPEQFYILTVFPAIFARACFTAIVRVACMFPHISIMHKPLWALATLEWSVASVERHMEVQTSPVREALPTKRTHMRALT